MDSSSNIVLTGFMGTGKTTVGRLLADKLGFDFVDTDVVIEERHGPIPAIFAERGEPAFRSIERELAVELAGRSKLVIATGGRMMLDPENVASLTRNGRVFCLVATPDEIYERVTSDASRIERPLLAVSDPRRRIVELLAERGPHYQRFAQLTTDSQAPEDIAADLATLASSDPRRFAIDSPSGDYDYAVGAAVLPFVRQLAAIDGPLVVITDDEAGDRYLASCPEADLVIRLDNAASGRNKDLTAVSRVYDAMIEAGIDRSATIVSLGDSIVGDVAAFAAATYLRGLDLVHCPTDLIAMIDTSVGGKVGLDVSQGRNLIGLFKQPKAVVADVATLQTLAPRQFAAGMAEVIKHGLIADSGLLSRIERGRWTVDGDGLPDRLDDLQSLVAQAVQVKIAVVQEDQFDEDQRRVLNLGHTFAHALEQVEQEQLLHGEAVGLGLVAAGRLSAALGRCEPALATRIEALVDHVGLPLTLPQPVDPGAILSAMDRDKKRVAGRRRFILLADVGDVFVSDDVPDDALLPVLESLQP